MGYYVSGNGELRIKKENLDKAHDALMAHTHRHEGCVRGVGL
jgi:hypothetical protein